LQGVLRNQNPLISFLVASLSYLEAAAQHPRTFIC